MLFAFSSLLSPGSALSRNAYCAWRRKDQEVLAESVSILLVMISTVIMVILLGNVSASRGLLRRGTEPRGESWSSAYNPFFISLGVIFLLHDDDWFFLPTRSQRVLSLTTSHFLTPGLRSPFLYTILPGSDRPVLLSMNLWFAEHSTRGEWVLILLLDGVAGFPKMGLLFIVYILDQL